MFNIYNHCFNNGLNLFFYFHTFQLLHIKKTPRYRRYHTIKLQRLLFLKTGKFDHCKRSFLNDFRYSLFQFRILNYNCLKLDVNNTKDVVTKAIQTNAFLISKRILKRCNTNRYSLTDTIVTKRYKYGIKRRKSSQKFVSTITGINGFSLFINITKYYS